MALAVAPTSRAAQGLTDLGTPSKKEAAHSIFSQDIVPASACLVTSDQKSLVVVDHRGGMSLLTLEPFEVVAKNDTYVLSQSDIDKGRAPLVRLHGVGDWFWAVQGTQLTLHDAGTLDVLASTVVVRWTWVFDAQLLDGLPACVAGPTDGPLRLIRFTPAPERGGAGLGDKGASEEEAGELVVIESTTLAQAKRAVFSSSGEELVTTDGRSVQVIGTSDGAPKGRRFDGFPAEVQSVAFHGVDRVAVGWGNESMQGDACAGVHVLWRGEDRRRVRLVSEVLAPFGGNVYTLESYPDLGLLVYGALPRGFVSAFSDSDWQEAWKVDFGGGSPGAITLNRCAGTSLGYASGDFSGRSAIIDLSSGFLLEREPLKGMTNLQGALEGKLTVGILDRYLKIIRR